jgi:hypothetical protein
VYGVCVRTLFAPSELEDQEAYRKMLAEKRSARLSATKSNMDFVGAWDKEREEVCDHTLLWCSGACRAVRVCPF